MPPAVCSIIYTIEYVIILVILWMTCIAYKGRDSGMLYKTHIESVNSNEDCPRLLVNPSVIL